MNFIFKIKPASYQTDYYLRFLLSPSEQLHNIFIAALGSLGDVNLLTEKHTADYWLNIKLDQLYVDNSVTPKQALVGLSVQLVLNKDPQQVLFWHHYQQSIAIQHYSSGAENIVLAWDKGIANILQQSRGPVINAIKMNASK